MSDLTKAMLSDEELEQYKANPEAVASRFAHELAASIVHRAIFTNDGVFSGRLAAIEIDKAFADLRERLAASEAQLKAVKAVLVCDGMRMMEDEIDLPDALADMKGKYNQLCAALAASEAREAAMRSKVQEAWDRLENDKETPVSHLHDDVHELLSAALSAAPSVPREEGKLRAEIARLQKERESSNLLLRGATGVAQQAIEAIKELNEAREKLADEGKWLEGKAHELLKLCHEIEKLPPGPQATAVVILASDIHSEIRKHLTRGPRE